MKRLTILLAVLALTVTLCPDRSWGQTATGATASVGNTSTTTSTQRPAGTIATPAVRYQPAPQPVGQAVGRPVVTTVQYVYPAYPPYAAYPYYGYPVYPGYYYPGYAYPPAGWVGGWSWGWYGPGPRRYHRWGPRYGHYRRPYHRGPGPGYRGRGGPQRVYGGRGWHR